MELFKRILPPDASYGDALLSYWKFLTLDLLFRYNKKYTEYKRLLKQEIDQVRLETLKKELIELREEIASVLLSLVMAIYPHLMHLYYAEKHKLKNYPQPVQEWIKDLVERGTSYLEEQLMELSKNIEEKELLQIIASVGVVLIELSLIPTDLKSVNL